MIIDATSPAATKKTPACAARRRVPHVQLRMAPFAALARSACARVVVALLLLFAATLAQAQAPAAIPPLTGPVVDTTGSLDAAAVQRIAARALDLQRRKGSQLQVLMVASTAPESIEQYTQRVFDAWQIGRKGVDDGVLVVVARDDRKARIQPGYGLEGAIPDITAGRIVREYMAPRFREGDYAGGLDDATAQITGLIDGEPLPEPMSAQGQQGGDPGRWLFALMAAFVAAHVVRGIFGGLPAGVRGLLAGGAGGLVAWVLSALLAVGGVGAAIGFFIGLFSGGGGGRYARGGAWGGFGGGTWSGGGGWGGGSSGGGWSGGGGMSGGGGASGSW